MIERPSLKVVRCHQAREVSLVQRDLDFESGDDAGDDAGVDLVNVVEPPCEALALDDAARARVGEFDRDRDRRSEHLDDPGQAVADVQDRPDFGQIEIGAAEAKGRTTGNDEQPTQSGQRGDQVMRERIRNGTVWAGRAQQPKRKDGNGRSRGGRESG